MKKFKHTVSVRLFFFIFLLSILFPSLSPSTDPNLDTNSKIKAMFIYNFTKYIEWPENYREGNFVLGIIGRSNLSKELIKMAETKKAGSQSFEIKTFYSPETIEKCHILYISPDITVNMNDILFKTKNLSTLIVSEKPGHAKQGAAINFVIQNNKQAFELNKSNAEKYNLKVSSSLSNLAIQID